MSKSVKIEKDGDTYSLWTCTTHGSFADLVYDLAKQMADPIEPRTGAVIFGGLDERGNPTVHAPAPAKAEPLDDDDVAMIDKGEASVADPEDTCKASGLAKDRTGSGLGGKVEVCGLVMHHKCPHSWEDGYRGETE